MALFSGKIISKQVERAMQLAPGVMGQFAVIATQRGAEEVRGKAIDNLSGPILSPKTSNLRSSISAIVDEDGMDSSARIGTFQGQLGSVLKYAAAHEFGSRLNKAVHWLKRSFEQVDDLIQGHYLTQMKKAVVIINQLGRRQQ